jgi:hypothetical protein
MFYYHEATAKKQLSDFQSIFIIKLKLFYAHPHQILYSNHTHTPTQIKHSME